MSTHHLHLFLPALLALAFAGFACDSGPSCAEVVTHIDAAHGLTGETAGKTALRKVSSALKKTGDAVNAIALKDAKMDGLKSSYSLKLAEAHGAYTQAATYSDAKERKEAVMAALKLHQSAIQAGDEFKARCKP